MFISVITPTYNRRYTLARCYKSLCEQTMNDFEWIIVDDGSTDDTKRLVEDFISEGQLKIRYLYQKNSGKHIAHNIAVKNVTGELVVCLDSDDWFVPRAIECISQAWMEIHKTDAIGIIAYKGDQNGVRICSKFPPNINKSQLFTLNHEFHFKGDTMLIFRKDVLQQKPFKEINGEKFLSESSLYFELDEFGPTFFLREVLYLCEYLEDGLSKRYHELLKQNPIGSTYYYGVAYKKSVYLRDKLKYGVLTNAYYGLIRDPEDKRCLDKIPSLATVYFLGLLYRVLKISIRK